MKSCKTIIASGSEVELRQHQPVLVLSGTMGKTWNGVVLSPARLTSLVRYNQDGVLKEQRIANNRLVLASPAAIARMAEEKGKQASALPPNP